MDLIDTVRPGEQGGLALWKRGGESVQIHGSCKRPPIPVKKRILPFQIWSVNSQASPFVDDSPVLNQI